MIEKEPAEKRGQKNELNEHRRRIKEPKWIDRETARSLKGMNSSLQEDIVF